MRLIEFIRFISAFILPRPQTQSLKKEKAPLFIDLISREGERDFKKAHELEFELNVLWLQLRLIIILSP